MGRINGHKPTGRIMQTSYFSCFCSEITAEWLQSYFQYFSSQTMPKFELIFVQYSCREITRLSIYSTVTVFTHHFKDFNRLIRQYRFYPVFRGHSA